MFENVCLIKAMDSGFSLNDAWEKIFKKRYNTPNIDLPHTSIAL